MTIAIEVYNPGGAVESGKMHAPRMNNLRGKTICELSNGGWEADRTLPQVSEVLKKRFPELKIIPYTEFPIGKEQIDADGIEELVKSKGCDGAIIGNAA